MQVLSQITGTLLVLIALVDIYLTVLHPRGESSLLSVPTARGVWRCFRAVAQRLPIRRDRFLSHGGPTIIITIIGLWVLLLLLGFTLMVWSGLGTGIQSESGKYPQILSLPFTMLAFRFLP